LATGADYRSIQELFGVGQSTACNIFLETVTAICFSMKSRFIRIPNEVECMNIAKGFEERWGFPQCIGAIDGTHIPIIAPHDNHNDYYNRKCFYSIVCQGVCDYRGVFWDIDVGFPGRAHDSRILLNSTIYELGERGRLFPNVTKNINGIEVPYCIIGDAAYPLKTWLLKPYRDNINTPAEEKYFNYRLSRARMTIECAFGRLKGRWRALLKRNDSHVAIMPSVVMASVILHNVCELRGEDFPNQGEVNDNDHAVDAQENYEQRRDDQLHAGHLIRQTLATYFSDNRL
jgi:hypothetical protein